MPYLKSVTVKIINCMNCINCTSRRTVGAGFAIDYYCKKAEDETGEERIIAGYVEWHSEDPQDNQIPVWCPLAKKKTKKVKEEVKPDENLSKSLKFLLKDNGGSVI